MDKLNCFDDFVIHCWSSSGLGSVQNLAAVHIAVKVGSSIWRQFGVVSSENNLKVLRMKFRPMAPFTVVLLLYGAEPEVGGSWK